MRSALPAFGPLLLLTANPQAQRSTGIEVSGGVPDYTPIEIAAYICFAVSLGAFIVGLIVNDRRGRDKGGAPLQLSALPFVSIAGLHGMAGSGVASQMSDVPPPLLLVALVFSVPIVLGLGPQSTLRRFLDLYRFFGATVPDGALTRWFWALFAWSPLALVICGWHSPVTTVVLTGAGAYYVLPNLMRKNVVGAIAKIVETPAPSASAPAHSQSGPPEPGDRSGRVVAAGAEPSSETHSIQSGALPSDISFAVVHPDELPEVSPEADYRFKQAMARGPALRRIWRRSTVALALAVFVISVALWLLCIARAKTDVTFPWFTCIAVAASLTTLFCHSVFTDPRSAPFPSAPPALLRYLSFACAPLTVASIYFGGRLLISVSVATGGVLGLLHAYQLLERCRQESRIGGSPSIRSIVLPTVGYCWMLFTIILIPFWGSDPYPELAFRLFGASALLFALAIWVQSRRLERDLPIQPPLSLLVLRVFQSNVFDSLHWLIERWRWVGIWQHLDGYDTVGRKLDDVINFFTGRVDLSVVENSDELMYELGRFAYTPASDLRFPMNSMQCNGAIWKAALDSLLDRADVVLMDLTGFCRENKGCLYEIQRLAESVPLSRLVLVVNDSTDIELVRETVIAAWSSAANGNRTLSQAPVCIRAVHIGKSAERAPTESLASWKQRAESGSDGTRLVRLLINAALPQRTRSLPVPLRWAHPLPAAIRTPSYILLGLALFIATLVAMLSS